jgi:hypothetical protein
LGAYDPGAFTPYDYLSSVRIPIYGIALNSYVNRTPLFTRLPQAPLGSLTFKTSTVLFRPSSQVLNNGGTVGSGDSTATVTDGSVYQTGDVIECGTEGMLITGISSNTITITRGYGNTSAASHTDGSTVYLIGNTRTGGEINVNGISRVPTTVTQYAQTFQHPYQVGGSLNSSTDFALPPGVTSVVGRERMMAIQNQSDDWERSLYYGFGVSIGSSTAKPMMSGLRALIATNKTLQPTNYTTYGPTDLIRDTLEPVYAAGGNPNVLVMSPDWMQGLQSWGQGLLRLSSGETEFGIAIDTFEAPFLNGVSLIFAPLLRNGTVICLSDQEIRVRIKRAMFDKPRGSQGDADQGDILSEGALELDNESHHAWVSGITGFATIST